jgi:hypothetical protein
MKVKIVKIDKEKVKNDTIPPAKKRKLTGIEKEIIKPKPYEKIGSLTTDFQRKVDSVFKYNKTRREAENIAKQDSIVGASTAKRAGKDLVDQKRAGNKQANITRVKLKIPVVERLREYGNNSVNPDKYHTTAGSSTGDSYFRKTPLEMDVPNYKTYKSPKPKM